MGNLELGEKVWYNCPECGEEKWALQSFVDSPCWQCLGHQEIANATNAAMKKTDPDFLLRRERFVTMSNGKALHPKSAYKYSNFRVLYKQVEPGNLTDDVILNILNEDNPSLASKYKSLSGSIFNSVGAKCVRLWTEQSNLYPRLGSALNNDSYDELKKLMPIIRGITSIVSKPTEQAMTTYRGSYILMKQFDTIKQGNVYRIPKIVATSKDPNVANGFLKGDEVKIKFVIDKNCWNAKSIAQYSAFQEDEVLLPPYTAVKITNKNKHSKEIEAYVMDNAAADRNCETRIM